ncbi:MAG: CRISPR-associated ring nuclease [Anaerolineae bacterium]|nr:CRISPR-associated ring nuclease [Anaerolineae bacterium]MDW8100536.1 CRISPR-associated ring nuclease [Anaerolineae bacterium]
MAVTTVESVMIATVGGQPQVLTFALDALLARGEVIREVIVLHLSADDPRLRRSLALLSAEFAGDRYAGRPCRYRPVPIRVEGRRLEDIRSEVDADAAWRAVHELIAGLKSMGERPLHLCIAGGRRLLALVALSAAMLLFGHQDQVWHIYTPRELLERARDGAIMHVRPEDGVRLIRVPLVPLGTQFPALRELAQMRLEDLSEVWMSSEAERQRCQTVWRMLSEREREVLHCLAIGLTPQEVASRLMISLSTVNSHKTQILAACRQVWTLEEDARLTYHFLREHFRPFIQSLLKL